MKKTITLLVVMCLILSVLTSCNTFPKAIDPNNPEEQGVENQSEQGTELQVKQDSNNDENTDQQNETPPSDVEWTYATYLIHDRDGYKYELNVKISPWILTENSSTLNAAWHEVGNNNPLPNSFSDWGLKKESNNIYSRSGLKGVENGNRYSYRAEMTNMYYCVGTISINNLTENWDITSADPRSLIYSLNFELKNWAGMSNTIARVFYNSKKEDSTGGIYSSPKLTDNTWGPCSFVMMHPENYSPNHPDGEFYEKLIDSESYFRYQQHDGILSEDSRTINGKTTNERLKIGVIGKDGQYIEPKKDKE